MEVLVWRGDVLVLGLEVAACLIRIYSQAVPDREQSTLSHSNQGTTLCLLEAAPMVLLLLFEVRNSFKVMMGWAIKLERKWYVNFFPSGRRRPVVLGKDDPRLPSNIRRTPVSTNVV